MSSRALRRLQREEEERKQLGDEQNQEQSLDAEEEGSGDGIVQRLSQPKKNAFDSLNMVEDEDDDSNDEPFNEDQSKATGIVSVGQLQDHTLTSIASSQAKRKKAKKKKKVVKQAKPPKPVKEDANLDEIDLALKSLKTDDQNGTSPEESPRPNASLKELYELLSIDSKHLNALNEMKKLFGSTVIGGERESGGAAAGRRRARGQVQLDLGAALTGRNSPISRGQGLAGLALRRNIFLPGKEEWPKATSGGLGMELVEKAWDFTTEYRFVHSSIYQGVQKQFDVCVESMDPQRMIQLLQLNPYHISTLLQVAEIAKHQGDQAVSVDLLERALFTFGRSVHSSFHTALSQGKARLDFRRPENREFWLAAYQYIGALGQRGTWRTAFEWAKLLLSLDPELDPYSMRLVIDQLAIRGGQFEPLVKLANVPSHVVDWGQHSPNVLLSLAMAHHKLKNPEKANETLRSAVETYPWVLARLYKELDIEPIPKSIWGRQARTDREELLSTAYVLRAKDVWNTPEALSLLKSVVESADRVEPPPAESTEISLNEARHIILSELPALIALVPRSITNLRSSSSDPLPPEDNVPSYSFTYGSEDDVFEEVMHADEREFQGIRSWFTGMLSRIGVNINLTNGNADQDDFPINDVVEALENSGVDINELASRTNHLEELRERQLAAEQRLRTLESDLNDIDTRARGTGLMDESAPAPIVNQTSNEREATSTEAQLTSSQEAHSSSGGYDDEANQRWLAGRGMLRLKDFIAQHGSDENIWKDNLDVDVTPATEYAHRITQLQKRTSKDWILNTPLKQGAGAEATDLIKRLISA